MQVARVLNDPLLGLVSLIENLEPLAISECKHIWVVGISLNRFALWNGGASFGDDVT